jgi:hypothetical protein
MFLLFDVAAQIFILRSVPEPFEVLIFGVGLILLTVLLRAILKGSKKDADGEIIHTTR